MKLLLSPTFLCLAMTLVTGSPLEDFSSGNKLFTASVYTQTLPTENGNFVISPFSAEAVLALTQAGAKGATAEEIRTSLHLPKKQEDIEVALRSVQSLLRKNDQYLLESANKIYVKDNFVIKDEFRQVATEVFGADLENINFEEKDVAANAINQWVANRTEQKIKDLIKPSDLDNRTRTILVNALYFKGDWANPFETYLTKKDDFFKNGNEVINVETMRDHGSNRFYEDKDLDAKFLELPFSGNEVSLIVVLPNQNDGLPALEKQLPKIFAPKFALEYVHVALPKFKIESSFDFKSILQQLGVTKAFDEQEADLSGIAGEKGDLVVDKVKQKTFIDVNELGVEAAAATDVAVGIPLSGFFSPNPPKEFRADHPFIFYIKTKDVVLFAGRVVDPSQ